MPNVKVKVIVEVNGERIEKETVKGDVRGRGDLEQLTDKVHAAVNAISQRGRRRV